MAWTRSLLRIKFKAMAVHLGISLVLVGTAVALMLLRWFPPPLFETDGGGIGLKLIVLVDLVLGPLLTFLVFNPAKTRFALRLDLSLIAAFQLAAYVGGMWSVHSVRVQTLAYEDGRFYSVIPEFYAGQEIAADGWKPLGPHAPYLVQVREPATPDEAKGVVTFGMFEGLMPHQLHFLYSPYAPRAADNWPRGWDLASLETAHPAVAEAARRWLRGRDLDAAALRFYRVEGYFASAVLVIDREGRWLGGFSADLPVRPKPASAAAAP